MQCSFAVNFVLSADGRGKHEEREMCKWDFRGDMCEGLCRKAGRQKGDRKYLRKHSKHRNELRFGGGKVCRGRVASGMIRGKDYYCA